MDGVVVQSWSKIQSNVALSSGEADLNAAVKGLSEGLGVANLFRDFFGAEPAIRLLTDASACKGMLLRQGCGRIKHLSTKQLWAQGAVDSYEITVEKIGRDLNSADALTHTLSGQAFHDHLRRVGFGFH